MNCCVILYLFIMNALLSLPLCVHIRGSALRGGAQRSAAQENPRSRSRCCAPVCVAASRAARLLNYAVTAVGADPNHLRFVPFELSEVFLHQMPRQVLLSGGGAARPHGDQPPGDAPPPGDALAVGGCCG